MTSRQAFEALSARSGDGRDPCLVDVRTGAEWAGVGVPDLSGIAGRVLRLSWQSVPGGPVDADFAARLADAGLAADQPLYFLCRSGARSQAAAEDAVRHGFANVHNVVDGFEGHPGLGGGWRGEGLPWRRG